MSDGSMVVVMTSDGSVVVVSQWWCRWWSWLSDGDDECWLSGCGFTVVVSLVELAQ